MDSFSPLSYSVPQRVVHWLSVLLIFFNLIFSGGMEHWSHVVERGETPTADVIASANIHAYVGFAILALLALRLVLRMIEGAPLAPEAEPPVFRLLSKIAHWALYAVLALMPFLGIGAYYWGNMTAGFLHGGPLKLLLWLLIVAHVGAVAVHQFFWRTNVLARMTRGV